MDLNTLIDRLVALREVHGGDIQVACLDTEFFCFDALHEVQVYQRGEHHRSAYNISASAKNPYQYDDLGPVFLCLSGFEADMPSGGEAPPTLPQPLGSAV